MKNMKRGGGWARLMNEEKKQMHFDASLFLCLPTEAGVERKKQS
jgi:hypothetical protein